MRGTLFWARKKTRLFSRNGQFFPNRKETIFLVTTSLQNQLSIKKVQMPNKNSSNHFSSCISSSTTNQVFIEGKVHWYSFKSHITTLFMSDGVAGLVSSNLERVSVRLWSFYIESQVTYSLLQPINKVLVALKILYFCYPIWNLTFKQLLVVAKSFSRMLSRPEWVIEVSNSTHLYFENCYYQLHAHCS